MFSVKCFAKLTFHHYCPPNRVLPGQLRCKVTFAGYQRGGGWGKRRQGTTSDAHRFAVLLSQLYKGRHSKSVQASVINVLARNRQVCLRMPKFKDTRSERQSRVRV